MDGSLAERVMPRAIDLRSDTVTQPTPAMREAIAKAPVGDDVYGEDPTVDALQRRAAQLVGKEAALFVPSGSMGNQASLRTLTRPGDVVLASENAHLLRYEAGAPAALWGVHVKTIGQGGLFDARDVRQAAGPSQDSHVAPTTVLAFENTHNFAGGRIFPLDALRDAAAAARELGLSLHLDGARLFNAVVATGVTAATWAELFDTVSFCLSKGLGAPVGSLVCGTRARIREVHRARKLMGGAMRQAGILAAAGVYALDHHIERLAVDHANAKRFAAGLGALGIPVRPAPETNMVMFEVADAAAFARGLSERALRINPIAPGRFRAVTHLDVSADDIEEALGRIEEIVREGGTR
ncbi:MAG TPA: GntG family PLP-dependent aldolase [Myxococcota bacterium]|nr:GntG family PLP-dependent aldolase [Myxococcota bacterium]